MFTLLDLNTVAILQATCKGLFELLDRNASNLLAKRMICFKIRRYALDCDLNMMKFVIKCYILK